MKKLFFLLALITVISACDKVEPPYKENHTSNIDTTTYVQKVLIEDFTGHRCGNCPRAHEKLTELIGIYGSKVIGMAIHGGFFADPLPPDYPDDFRTVEGTDLTNSFGVTTWPIGMVNRTPQSGSLLLAYDAWAEPVEEIVNEQPQAYITIQASLNTANNTATANTTIKILQPMPDSLKLCVYLTEDSIIAAQTDYAQTPNLVPNYVQNHVLRKSFNGTWGNGISLANKQTGDTIQRSFSLTWNSAWNSKHCHVISYIYNINSNRIIQVNESAVQ